MPRPRPGGPLPWTALARWFFPVTAVAAAVLLTALFNGAWSEAAPGPSARANGTIPGVSCNAGYLELVFADLQGAAISSVVLNSTGDEATVAVCAGYIGQGEADTLRLVIEHDDDVVSIEQPQCSGLYGAAPDLSIRQRTGDDLATLFECTVSGGPSADSGEVFRLTVRRLAAGQHVLRFRTSGAIRTMLSQQGAPVEVTATATLSVLQGSGPSSPPSEETGTPEPTPTPVPAPPGPPRNVRVTPGNGLITLQWDSPDLPGRAAVTGYRVLNVTTGAPDTVGADARQWDAAGLTNGKMYQFQISALSASGAGESVITNPVAPHGLPSAPRNVSWAAGEAPGSVLVTWAAPQDDGGGITGYEVAARRWDSGGLVLHEPVAGAATSVLLTGLPAGVEMFFLVRAISPARPGPYADTAGSLTLPPDDVIDYVSDSLQFGSLKIQATPEQDEALAQAISAALGVPTAVLGRLGSIPAAPGHAGFFMPFRQSVNISVPGAMSFEVGALAVQAEGTRGVAVVTLSSAARVEGAVALFYSPVGMEIDISEMRLIVEPQPSGPDIAQAAESGLGFIGARLTTAIRELSGLTGPQTAYSFGTNEMALDGVGPLWLPGEAVAAYTVGVTGGPSNEHLGATTVEFALGPAWLAGLGTGGYTIAVIKTSEGGGQAAREAECETVTLSTVCTAVFDGDDAGFSAFTLAALAEWPYLGRPVEPVTPTAAPTSTPLPTPTATAAPAPTGTPLSEFMPTVPAGASGLEGGGPGGGTPWALIAVLVGFAVVASGGVGAIMHRRRSPGGLSMQGGSGEEAGVS